MHQSGSKLGEDGSESPRSGSHSGRAGGVRRGANARILLRTGSRAAEITSNAGTTPCLQGNLEDDFSDEAEFLTDGCKKLKALDFQYQAEFWKEMASAFGPWKYTDPRADVDAVVRYFDGTLCGVEYMMMYSKGRENLPDNESICRLLVHKYGFLGGRDHDAVMKNEKFQEFCRLILDDDPEREEVAVSACWAFRHLRVGALLGKPRDPKGWNVYYYNYDDSKVDGSVVASRRKERVFKNKAWVEEMIVEPQMSCGSLPSSRYPDCTPPVSVDEFFMKPLSHTLNVHWAHAHNPCQECILALGQHYRLRVHSQCLLTRLEDASAQMEFANNDDWSSIVFPAVYLDQESRRSLQRYRVWMQKKTVKAAMSGRTLGVALSPSAFDVSEVHLQPHIDIGVVRMNLMIFWSARDESTVVSVAAKPKYNAKWETPRRRQKGSMLPAWLFFWRRSKPEKEGYKRVPTSAWEDDDGFLLESDVEEGRAETEQEMEEEEEEEAPEEAAPAPEEAGHNAEEARAATEPAAPEEAHHGADGGSFKAYIQSVDICKAYEDACKAGLRKVNACVRRSLHDSVQAAKDTFFIEAPGNDKLTFTNRLTDDDMQIFAQVFMTPSVFLQRLDLSYNHLTDVGATELAQTILAADNNTRRLTSLNLRSNSSKCKRSPKRRPLRMAFAE
mmetsp:Transcript_26007/g.67724  ORF Transcript_26007/g.67724 Transcript_26007/m.67724 type:complete len:671 (+) Transcript_26007:97-2109(+)